MRYSHFLPARRVVFYGFLPWFLVKVAALLMCGAMFIELSVRLGSLWWLLGLALCAGAAMMLTLRYNTEMLIVQHATLVCRRGTLLTHETTVPLWPIVMDVRQNLLGRALNYGTVQLRLNNTVVELRNIAHISYFCDIVAQRQADILLSEHSSTLSGHSRYRAA
jgi:membrane protein YdbS with pleckstrin-like domain